MVLRFFGPFALDLRKTVNKNLRVTPNHPLFINKMWKNADDLRVEIEPSEVTSGVTIGTIYVNTTIVDISGNVIGYPDDNSNLKVRIYDETGADVTESIGSLSQTDLDGSANISLTNVYFTVPGTYTIHAFSNTRQSLDSNNATFVVSSDITPPSIDIIKPEPALYIFNKKFFTLSKALLIGSIDIKAISSDNESGIKQVKFFIDDEFKYNDTVEPYTWTWDERTLFKFRHTIKVTAYDKAGNFASDEILVWKFL